MAKAEIDVAVERVIHDAIAEILLRIAIQHGIQVHTVRADWLDISTYGESNTFKLANLRVDSSSRHA